MEESQKQKLITSISTIIIAFIAIVLSQSTDIFQKIFVQYQSSANYYSFTIHGEQIPVYTNKSFYEVNNDEPFFTISEKSNIKAKEIYNDLDDLGRATYAFAVISNDTIPKESRESLSYNPSGWVQTKYVLNGKETWLYNRCHLIGYQLTGQNNNPRNLITGTRQFNVNGMLPFETQVAQYVAKYNGHCLCRVTPYYEGNNLVATGVLMESYSVEHNQEATFCVFVYNVQDGVMINYEDGTSCLY